MQEETALKLASMERGACEALSIHQLVHRNKRTRYLFISQII